jgi:hypothetical protein
MKLAILPLGAGQRSRGADTLPADGVSTVQFGDEVLVLASDAGWRALERSGQAERVERDTVIEAPPARDLHLVVQTGRVFQQAYPGVRVLLDRGRFLVVELDPERARAIMRRPEPGFAVQPLPENEVVYDVRPRPAARASRSAWVESLVDGVDHARVKATMNHLVAFPTRLSTSSHFAAAAAWVRDQLDGMGYATTTQTVSLPGGTTRNVIANRPGHGSGSRDLIVVGAHLDSINHQGGPAAAAPGADDNGSGSAGLLEIAAALQDLPAVNDLRLVAFGGEEQGLFGSKRCVARLSAADRGRVRAMVNMDMIGTANTPAPTVLLEGAPISQAVIDGLAAAASAYTGLTVQTSLHPYASDHVPFIDAGLPAVLTIEGTDDANPHEHTANDTLEFIDDDLMLEILRMNTAYVATVLERFDE